MLKGFPLSGSVEGSLRMRSSIGSRPIASASSSSAVSSANIPVISPGARMKMPGALSCSTAWWIVRRFGTWYIIRLAERV